MKKKLPWAGGAVLCAALVFAAPLPTRAAGGVIALAPDEDNLFLQMSDMLPGQSYSDTFTVTNRGADSYDFYLQAESAVEDDFDTGPEALQSCESLLQQLEMTVVVHRDGAVEEYSGKANQVDCREDHVAMIGRRIDLGRLVPGASVQIEATVAVPTALDNAHAGVQGKFWWHFTAEGAEGVVDAARPGDAPTRPWEGFWAPQTGDRGALWPWLLLAASLAGLVVLGRLRAKGSHGAKKGRRSHSKAKRAPPGANPAGLSCALW